MALQTSEVSEIRKSTWHTFFQIFQPFLAELVSTHLEIIHPQSFTPHSFNLLRAQSL